MNDTPEAVPFDITSDELNEWRKAHKPHQLIDVREPYENIAAHLSDDVLMPMGEFAQRMSELDPERDIVVYCRSGNRSSQVVQYMRKQGFSRARNLEGGIVRWAQQYPFERAESA
jgi:rhodanese-related sulfurtransferase